MTDEKKPIPNGEEEEEKSIECHDCGEVMSEDTGSIINNNPICEDCLDNYHTCDHCGEVYDSREEGKYVEDTDKHVCDSCLVRHYVVCDDCGDTVHNNNSHTVANGDIVCESCLENYCYCEGCNEYYPEDQTSYCEREGYSYCDDCYPNEDEDDRINNYSYRPNFKFYGDRKSRFFGIEIEAELKGNSKIDYCDTVDGLLQDNQFYIKEDGSLSEGLELVSMPHTLQAYYDNFKLINETLHNLIKLGCRSHDTNTCGLHIHASRKDINAEHISKLEHFFLHNKKFIEKLSRRDSTSYCRYKDKNKTTIKEVSPKNCKKGCINDGRYAAINWQNKATVEFRTFKGTLNTKTIYASIEFVDAVIKYTKITNHKKLRSGKRLSHFFNFLSKQNYKFLTAYLTERKILCA